MDSLPDAIHQQFLEGISLQDAAVMPSNVSYKVWSRLFGSLATTIITFFMLYQAMTQPIWPDWTIIAQNWPSSLLLLILILGWYIAIGYFMYWTWAHIVLLCGQRRERIAQANGGCHHGMWLMDEGMGIRLQRRPFTPKCELFLQKTAVTSASSFLKRDNRNVAHWHLRISYINKKGAETSTSFPYNEFQCRHVDQLTNVIQEWLLH